MFYWIKTPAIVKYFFSNFVWHIPNNEKKIYLTFDDGPTPEVTLWVLAQLKKYDAKATFFCIGKNVENQQNIFSEIISDNHAIGNHTQDHINGWYTATAKYVQDVNLCEAAINKAVGAAHQNSNVGVAENLNQKIFSEAIEIKSKPKNSVKLFRPPYGKIKQSQAKAMRNLNYKIVMWDVLSADFDTHVSKEKCLDNVLKNVKPGSIIIFHDSHKAFDNLKYVLPKVLDHFNKKGFAFDKI